MATTERFWTRRLRWRLRGAWTWPLYGALTIVDAVILHELPPLRTGVDLGVGLILASFGNLFLIGVVSPWIGRRLAERDRRDPRRTPAELPPPEVHVDRTAAALLLCATFGLIVAGLATRPLVVSETEATERNAELVREHVMAGAPDEIRRNLETADTIRLEEDYFRTCIAYDDRRRAWCLFVDTEQDVVKRDPSTLPNREFKR